jgi:hypothetical protein
VDDHGVGGKVGLQRVGVEKIELVEGEAGVRPGLGQVPLLHAPGVERIEVVDPDHGIALTDQRLDQVRPDEAGRTGDEDSGHRPPRPIP